jgi:hypothetical protein
MRVGDLRRPVPVVRGVELGEPLPLLGYLVLGEDRVNGAGLYARVAIDAFLGVDEELIDLLVIGFVGGRMDAVDRADLDARVVLDPDTRFCDHIGHCRVLCLGCFCEAK